MAETNENIQTQGSGNEPAQETQQLSGQSSPVPFEISVLPLQQTTLFPETVVPLAVGRSRSITAVESALATEEKLLACISIRTENMTGADATPGDLYNVGTLVQVKRMMRSDETMQLIVQGTERVKVLEWIQEQPYLRARVEINFRIRLVIAARIGPSKKSRLLRLHHCVESTRAAFRIQPARVRSDVAPI